MKVDPSEFARALGITLLVGAARADSTPEQFAALREKVPELEVLIGAGDWDAAEKAVRSVMPAGWEPGEEWRLRD